MVTRRTSCCCLHFVAGCLLIAVLQGGKEVTVLAFSLQHPSSYCPPTTRTTIMPRPINRMNTIGTTSSVRIKCATRRTPPGRVSRISPSQLPLLLLAKSDNDSDEERGTAPGMKDAFRQLEALESIGDLDTSSSSEKGSSSSSKSPPSVESNISSPMIQPPFTTVPLAETAPPEKQVQVYTEMVKELEQLDQEELYSDVLADMGGDPSTMTASKSKSLLSSLSDISDVPSSLSESDTENFMNQALQEALQEAAAKAKDSKAAGGGSKIADSVLNDKEIMKEIEQIFERGNDQLMESIEEMRAEQRELAKASAEDTAKSAMDNIDVNAQRLARAESSMVAMLERVNQETAAVEKAVQDLQQAQMDTTNNTGPAAKLRQGGLPKQAALVGLLLFSFRSIADSIAVMGESAGSGGDMTAALIQGAIALACGVYLILF